MVSGEVEEEDWDWTDLGEDDEWGNMFDVMDGAADEAAPAAESPFPAAAAAQPEARGELLPDLEFTPEPMASPFAPRFQTGSGSRPGRASATSIAMLRPNPN